MKPGIAGKMHIRILSFFVLYSVAISPITKSAVAQSGLSGPFALTCDSLTQPLGIDSTKPRFAWKLKDGSEVTGKATAHVDSPDAHAIPWLLLSAVGHAGGGMLAAVTHIQRIHTKGGEAPPAAQCDASRRNSESRSAYSADYYFYAPEGDEPPPANPY